MAEVKRFLLGIFIRLKTSWTYVSLNEKLQFTISAIGLIILIVYTGATIKMYRANKEAADAAKSAADTAARELELSERPWISADFSAVSPLVIDSAGLRITIQTTITNVGHSPAVKAAESLKLYTSFLLTPDPWKMRDEVCHEAERDSNAILSHTNTGLTQTWFPGNQPPRIATYPISRDEIIKGMVQPSQVPHGMNPPPWYSVNIAYCASYYSSFSSKQYHTGYLLQIVRSKLLPPPRLFQNFSLGSEITPVTIIHGAISGMIPMGPDAN